MKPNKARICKNHVKLYSYFRSRNDLVSNGTVKAVFKTIAKTLGLSNTSRFRK